MTARDLTLSDFPFVASLADSANPNDRRIWLKVACDHFAAVGGAEPEALESFADAVIRQIDKADRPAILETARKLAPSPLTPARLLRRLEAASPEASDVVLEHGRAYPRTDLVHALEADRRRAAAVARRPDLDAGLIGAIVALSAPEPLVALVGNPRARLDGPIHAGLVRRARSLAEDHGDRRLADALLRRRPLRPEIAALFLVAGPLQRVEILLAAQRAQLGRPHGGGAPVAPETVRELELAAVARHPDRFVAALASALGSDAALAARIADDPSGEPLAVALAALGAPNDVLVRVLIANDLETGENYHRIRALARLNNALTRQAATIVMAALKGEPLSRAVSAPATEPAPSRDALTRRVGRPAVSPPQRKAAG